MSREISAENLDGVSGAGGRRKGTSTFLLLLMTAILLLLCFPPFYCFFLAPVALVPFAICIVRRPFTKRYYFYYYLLGCGFFLGGLWWLGPVTWIGYVLLSMYLGIYFTIFAVGFYRLTVQMRLPATVALPVMWTAVEFIRSTFVQGGFPWFMMGNSFAAMPLMIQTADLFGVWGVTFFIAMLNGCVVDLLRWPLYRGKRFNPSIGWVLATAAVSCAFVIGYGVYRMREDVISAGPRVAVIQENLPQTMKDDSEWEQPNYEKHRKLTEMAAAAPVKPDLIVWPETMIPGLTDVTGMNPRMDPGTLGKDMARSVEGTYYLWQMEDFSNKKGIPLLLGINSIEIHTTMEDSPKQNMTVLVMPGLGVVEHYAKVHLVPFGEYIPFKSLPVVGKYMVNISPNGQDFSATPGEKWTRFELPAGGGKVWTFGTPICFEDCMPEPARMMAKPVFDSLGVVRKADFLVNVSNDGWFYPAELNQRMQASQLRAVENRVPVARSVNTGNSGFIDSCGRIVGLVRDGTGNSIGAVGTAAEVLMVDSRVTLFSRVGDLLPIVCGVVGALLVGWTFVRPRRGLKT